MKHYAGWLHCVREPSKYLGINHPRMLLANSDLEWANLL